MIEVCVRELEKIAREKHPDAPSGIPYVAGAVVPMLTAGPITQALLSGGKLGEKLKPGGELVPVREALERQGVHTIIDKYLPEHSAKLTDEYIAVMRRMGVGSERVKELEALKEKGVKEIISVKPTSRTATFFHEAGHATGGLGKKILQPLYGIGIGFGAPLAVLMAAQMPEEAKRKGKSTPRQHAERIEGAQKVVGGAGLLYAPVLAEEARASGRALLEMRKRYPAGKVLRGAGRLGAAYATYLSLAAPTIASLAWMQKYKKSLLKAEKPRQEKKKVAFPEFLGRLMEEPGAAWTPQRLQHLAQNVGVGLDDAFCMEHIGRPLEGASEPERALLATRILRSASWPRSTSAPNSRRSRSMSRSSPRRG
jgi:hypothetical protein